MFKSRFSQSAALFGGLSLAVSAGALQAADQIETPDYEVIASQEVADAPGPRIEVRRYAPMIVAEVTVEAESREAASSAGFRPLADYIFGNNRPQDSIAMTAPVTTSGEITSGGPDTDGAGAKILMTSPVITAKTPESGSEGQKIAMTAPVATSGDAAGRYTVRFMIPSKYTLDTLPAPVNADVQLRELDERALVALRLTGLRSEAKIDAAEAALSAYIEANKLIPSGPFVTAGYDGPRTAPEDRRWEVQRPVKFDDSLD